MHSEHMASNSNIIKQYWRQQQQSNVVNEGLRNNQFRLDTLLMHLLHKIDSKWLVCQLGMNRGLKSKCCLV